MVIFQITVVPLTVSLPSGSIAPLWTPAEVNDMIREANQIWNQYSIQIHLLGITERSLASPGAIGGIGASDLPGLPGQLRVLGAVAVLTHRLRGNVHAGLAIRGGRICALQWPIIRSGETTRMRGRVLAHELGHLLGLDDYHPSAITPGDIAGQLASRNNLMASSVSFGTLLTPPQILDAHRSPWLR
jgi:hypothetical protein